MKVIASSDDEAAEEQDTANKGREMAFAERRQLQPLRPLLPDCKRIPFRNAEAMDRPVIAIVLPDDDAGGGASGGADAEQLLLAVERLMVG